MKALRLALTGRTLLALALGTVPLAYAGCAKNPKDPLNPPQAGGTGQRDADARLGQVVTEEVRFQHAEDSLAGTLYLPDTRGPHPAVAMVFGSGDADRHYGGIGPALGNHFARSGIVCLIWDRPGVGESTGDYNAQTFHDRAGEALAAVRFLRKRSDVRSERVGLWGHSQGGMVAPLAASLSDEVAFLIEVSGWQGPVWQQDLVRVEAEVRAAGYPDSDVRRAAAFARERMDLIRGTGPYEELDKLQSTAKAEKWFRHVGYCGRALFESARKNVGYDTTPSWEGVHCPVLVIYGDRDTSSGPPEGLITVIGRGLKKAGNRDVSIKVFPGADHSLCVPSGDWGDGQTKAKLNFAPGYLELMTGWTLGKAQLLELGRDESLRHPP